MKIIVDCRSLRMYPLLKDGFRGGTELYVREVADGLAARGHTVHLVANDCEVDEQLGPNLYAWPTAYHPHKADAVVAVHNLECLDADYHADLLLLASNGVDPDLGPDGAYATGVDAYPVFSQCHADLLVRTRPSVDPAKCHVTGLGVSLADYPAPVSWLPDPDLVYEGIPKVPGRIFVSNDPARGLWHVLDVFDHVRRQVPEATLHVGYDFERQFALRRWESSALGETLWDCRRRLAETPGVVNLGALTREQTIAEQLACQVHLWPSEPPNVGSQIHGMTQMECGAAGAALVLSDTEAFPEVFGEAATILPVPGTYLVDAERRYDAEDWSEAVVGLMRDPAAWAEASRKARALAEGHTWSHVVARWQAMLDRLTGKDS